MKAFKPFLFFIFLCNAAKAQDIDYARKVIENLCAP